MPRPLFDLEWIVLGSEFTHNGHLEINYIVERGVYNEKKVCFIQELIVSLSYILLRVTHFLGRARE